MNKQYAAAKRLVPSRLESPFRFKLKRRIACHRFFLVARRLSGVRLAQHFPAGCHIIREIQLAKAEIRIQSRRLVPGFKHGHGNIWNDPASPLSYCHSIDGPGTLSTMQVPKYQIIFMPLAYGFL
ncbi:MAG TPA: hypothetical protein VIU46_11190 [Gallionellaceae bacterium]